MAAAELSNRRSLIAAPPCAVKRLHAYRRVWTKAVLER